MRSYDEEWKRYRRLKLAFLISNLGFLGVAIPTFVSARLRAMNRVFFVLIIAWFVWYSVSYERFRRFQCPRCGRYFSSPWLNFLKLSAKECVHCGLPRYSVDRG
jgi:hypothetical protein